VGVITDTNGNLFDSASNLFASNLAFLQPFEFPFASNIVHGGIIPPASAGNLTNHVDVQATALATGQVLQWNGAFWTNLLFPITAGITNGFIPAVNLNGPVWSTNGFNTTNLNGFAAYDSTATNFWRLRANPNMATNVNWMGPTNVGTGLLYGTNELAGSATNVLLRQIANGTANQVLSMVGGIPTWASAGALGAGPFTNLTIWSHPTYFMRTNGQVPPVLIVSNTATASTLLTIDGTGDLYARNVYATQLNVGANLLGTLGDIYATNHIVAYTTGIGFVGDGSGLTNLGNGAFNGQVLTNHFTGASLTNTVHAGSNIFSLISFARRNITTIANGFNADINLGTNVFVKFSGASAAFTNCGFVAGSSGEFHILVNMSTFDMDLANESGVESTAANRITCLTGADKKVTGNSAVMIIYDDATSRWIPLTFTQ
jgi:hypothetical protein